MVKTCKYGINPANITKRNPAGTCLKKPCKNGNQPPCKKIDEKSKRKTREDEPAERFYYDPVLRGVFPVEDEAPPPLPLFEDFPALRPPTRELTPTKSSGLKKDGTPNGRTREGKALLAELKGSPLATAKRATEKAPPATKANLSKETIALLKEGEPKKSKTAEKKEASKAKALKAFEAPVPTSRSREEISVLFPSAPTTGAGKLKKLKRIKAK